MSHVVQIQTRIKDIVALRAACGRLGLGAPAFGTSRLYAGSEEGWAVNLKEWRYPVVFDIKGGNVRFDNFEGRWGETCHLDRLLQAYAVEKATVEARRSGHSVAEQSMDDGSIKLTVSVGGAA